MFIIRNATSDDLRSVQRLARVLNTVNLPDDEKSLETLIELSERSFLERVKAPLEREYLFVMEDTKKREKIVGTSQIIAQHGTREAPHIYFDVLEEERYSQTIEKHGIWSLTCY